MCLRLPSALFLAAMTLTLPARGAEDGFPLSAKRIVFLGDSNTYGGGTSVWLETQLRLHHIHPLPAILNLGLPSETCCGLSEPAHPFPRPNVHERVARALAQLKPDVVVCCYGMNDAIYHPFSEVRFKTFQKGMNSLIEKVRTSGAKLILLTPPAFDRLPMQTKGKLRPIDADSFAWFAIYEDYDQVIQRYADWVLTQRERAAMVIDIHAPVVAHLKQKRSTDPSFVMSPDGVHVNAEGHAVIGRAILKAWGIDEKPQHPALFELVTQKQGVLRDAWLSQIGHQRPGVSKGLGIEEAKRKAADIEAKIETLSL